MMNPNDLIAVDATIYRVICIQDDLILAFDCLRKAYPAWMVKDQLTSGTTITENDLRSRLAKEWPETISLEDTQMCNRKYTVIAPILPVLGDTILRNKAVSAAAKQNKVTAKCIKKYLFQYLTYNDKRAFIPKAQPKPELSQDQKNMRWALNKYYYTRNGKTLADTYTMLIADKYTDHDGKVLHNHPSIHQFTYFFRKNLRHQTRYISRDGLKNYQMNRRPLLGEGVREFAPNVGVGMLDSTICDIYLCDKSGTQVAGRPILTACIDAYSGLCCGYSLSFEGGVYSIREMLLNTLTDKVEWCRKFGIEIDDKDWDCTQLMGTYVTDRGTEYTSVCVEQLSDLGITIINLPPFRGELKGPVERFFQLIQDSYKHLLKGRGVIEPDAGRRGIHDYRQDACLTIEDFERIILQCILHYNRNRIIPNFPYTKTMLDAKIAPHPSTLWNYGKGIPGANLLTISKEQLIKTMLPRAKGKYTQRGLIVNKLRYRNDAYTEQYLAGGETTVAYNPDNVNKVYVIQDNYAEFDLIESRFSGLPLDAAMGMIRQQKDFIDSFSDESLQAKVDLTKHITTIANQRQKNSNGVQVTYSQQARTSERYSRHRDLLNEVKNEEH